MRPQGHGITPKRRTRTLQRLAAGLEQATDSIYGTFGISVFADRDVPVDEPAQQAPLVRFEALPLVQVGVLRAAGFRLEPTGQLAIPASRSSKAHREVSSGLRASQLVRPVS